MIPGLPLAPEERDPREVPVPPGLCPEHKRIWLRWRAVRYSALHPTEWPGGSHIMDSRTSHAERRAGWNVKTRQQMASIEDCCRSGISPQCTPKEG